MNESPLRNPATDDDEQPTETWASIGDVAKKIVRQARPGSAAAVAPGTWEAGDNDWVVFLDARSVRRDNQ